MSAATSTGNSPAMPGPAGAGRALVVDDEPSLVTVVAGYLRAEGLQVLEAGDGPTALTLAREQDPDLIVLDLGLPGMDGIEVCRALRTFTDAYIVMLTARADEIDMLIGLGVGADDYVTKPFSPRELIARVRVLLRRPRTSTTHAEQTLPARRFGDLLVDPAAREATLAGRPVLLTKTEFDLLDALSAQPRVVFSRGQLLERVWGGDWAADQHLVDIHIGHLRSKLGDDARRARYVKTVRGVGYRMGRG